MLIPMSLPRPEPDHASKKAENSSADGFSRSAVPKSAEEKLVTASKEQPSPLTPEEQMALFEKELKENDWGHQPC